MIPFIIMCSITCIWVLIGAMLIMPYFADRKVDKTMKKKGLTVENIKAEIKRDIVGPLGKKMEDTRFKMQENLHAVEDRIKNEISIPSMTEFEDSVEKKFEEKAKEIRADLVVLQDNIPAIFNNYILSEEGKGAFGDLFELHSKRITGAIYGEMGVDEKAFKGGMEDAKQWITNGGNGQSPKQRHVRAILTDIVGPEMAENLDRKLGALAELKQHLPEILGKGGGGGSAPGLPSGGSELAYY